MEHVTHRNQVDKDRVAQFLESYKLEHREVTRLIPETPNFFMLSSASAISFDEARYDSETNSSTSAAALDPDSVPMASSSISGLFPSLLLSPLPTTSSLSMS